MKGRKERSSKEERCGDMRKAERRGEERYMNANQSAAAVCVSNSVGGGERGEVELPVLTPEYSSHPHARTAP